MCKLHGEMCTSFFNCAYCRSTYGSKLQLGTEVSRFYHFSYAGVETWKVNLCTEFMQVSGGAACTALKSVSNHILRWGQNLSANLLFLNQIQGWKSRVLSEYLRHMNWLTGALVIRINFLLTYFTQNLRCANSASKYGIPVFLYILHHLSCTSQTFRVLTVALVTSSG